jgi:murein DD-endopeptidase MepM/ murein hydrolase activator NlpD
MSSAARWLVCLAALLACGPAQAARLYRWKDAGGVTQYGDQPPPSAAGNVEVIRFRNPPGTLARLRIEPLATRYQVWADNLSHGPVQVEVSFRQQQNLLASPGLPLRKVLPAKASVLLSSLIVTDPLGGGQFDLQMDAMPGDPQARPFDFRYRLPFDEARLRVDQGPGGHFSHNDLQNRDAIDFAIPEGTPILAARAGVVVQVESDFDKAGLDREIYGGRANFVRILHEDGTMALYAHLKPEGVLVRTGQSVREGQQIGLSGNTGFSTAPHLHFVVQVNAGMTLRSVPVRMVGPMGELHFPSLPGAHGGP